MGLFKRAKKPVQKDDVSEAVSVQTSSEFCHPFNYLNGYTPLASVDDRLYKSIREGVPIVDSAIMKIIRLMGGFTLTCNDKIIDKAMKKFFEGINVGGNQQGLQAFVDNYMSQLLTYGSAIGEMVADSNGFYALYNAKLSCVEVKRDENNLNLVFYPESASLNQPFEHQERILFSVLNPEPSEIRGTSILKGLPFITDILLKIYNTIGTNWQRVGNVRYAVTYKPQGDGIDKAFAKERANQMAQALQKMEKTLYAVGNRTYEKAVAFAEKYGVQKVYSEIDEMFTDKNVDIIYITSPHNTHYAFMKKALLHGKHLFVEKSITLNSRELDEMIALAREKNLILAEAMTIWHMPIYKKLWETVRSGSLGKVQMITMNFGSFKEYNMNNRFFNMNLAGGAMLDIGVYALSIVRSFMDEKPDEILSQWKPSPTGSDEQATILLKNPSGQMATVALSMHSKQPKRAMISCEKGYIEIMEYPRADKAVIVDAETGEKTEISCGDTSDALLYEMEDMEHAVLTCDTSGLHLNYTKDVMDIMTYLRKEWNMKYPDENWD